MKTKVFVYSFALLLVVALSTTVVFAADMYSGTWKVNIAKSKYSPGPAPKSGTTKIEGTADGFKLVADGVNSEGKKTHVEFTVTFDGKDHPFTSMIDGKPNPTAADMISGKKIDDSTNETTTKLKGKVLTVAKMVIAKNGKTMTTTFTGVNAQGQKVNNTVVSEKQ